MTAGSGAGSLLGVSVLELRTDNRMLDSGLARARADAEKSGAQMQAMMDRRLVSVGQSMSRAGSRMTRDLSIPIIGLGVATADMAKQFQQAMEMIRTQAGASQQEVDSLSGKVLALAKTLPQSPQQLAQGLFHLESIGLRGAKAMDALKTAAQGAAVGNADLEQTTTALGAAWLVNIKGAGNLHQVMGILNATVGAGNMRMQELVDALGTGVLPSAKLAGLGLKDVMGALAVFTDEGYNASSAAAQFATALHFLTNPTAKADSALKGIGLSGRTLATDMHKPQGLLTALTDLKTHLDELPGGIKGVPAEQVLGSIFPAGRGRVMLTLLNQLDRYGMKLGQIGRTSAQFSQDIAASQQTAAYKIHTAWSTIESDAIQFGDKVLPDLLAGAASVANDVDKVATAFSQLPKGAQDAIITGGLITAGLGPALKLLGVFTSGVGKLWQISRVAERIAMGKGLQSFNTSGGAGAAARTMGAGMVSGVRGPEMPGSAANPIVVAIESGQFANLGSRAASVGAAGAGGSVSAAEKNLAAGERRTAGGVILPAGTRSVAPQVGLTAAEETAVTGGMMASLKGAGGTLLARGMQGLLVGSLGTAASQIIGTAIHGSVGSAIKEIGTDTSIGAGFGAMFGPEGMAGGAIIGGLVGTFKHFFAHDAGQTTANSIFSHGFGGAQAPDLAKQTAAALDALNKYTTGSKTIVGPRGVRMDVPVHLSIESLSPADQQKALTAAQTAGTLVAKTLENGWNQYKFQSEPVMFSQLRDNLRKLPPEAQSYAIDSASHFVAGLEQKGRVAKGATDQFLAQIMQEFPAAVRQMGVYGFEGAGAFAKALNFRNAEVNLKGNLRRVSNDFSDVQKAVSDASGSIEDKTLAAIHALLGLHKNGSGPMRKQALADLHLLRAGIETDLDAMEGKVSAAASGMSAKIQKGSYQAEQVATTNFTALAQNITAAMNAGIFNTGKGGELIAKALNATLKAFGAKPVPVNIDLQYLSTSGATKTMGGAKAYQNIARDGSQTATVNAQGQQLDANGNAYTHAQGGLIQIGRPGEAGRDTVPLSVGGQSVVVAPGEQVAVFNRHQLPIVNAALSPVGGLPGLFSRVNTPNYMAAGGMVPGFAGGGMVNDQVARMIQTANAINARHYPYLWGGGHNASFAGPYDCSGAVSAILHAAGLLNAPEVSGQLMGYGLPGPGAVTIYANPVHTFMSIDGRFFGTHGADGAGWYGGAPLPGFTVRHAPVGAGSSIKAPKVVGGGTIGTLGQAALNKEASAANAKVAQVIARMTAGGGSGGGDWGTFGPVGSGPWTTAARAIAQQHGWDANQLQAWWGVEQIEDSSLSLTATNPSSGAYGLAQGITGPGWYAAHGGDSHTLVGQLTAMANYIAGRYGTPSAALAAEHTLGYYARGGLVPFAGGGQFTTDTRTTRAPGSPRQVRHGKGYGKPSKTGAKSTKPRPGQKNTKSAAPKKGKPLPKFKPLPGFAPTLLDQIATLDTSTGELSNWQSYLTSLHSSIAAEAVVTLADGTQVVNWDGMVDPSTGQWVKGINQRLAEIGDPGANPNATATRDRNTELGVDELMLDAYQQEQGLANRVMYGSKGQNRSFGAWLSGMVADLKKRQDQVNDLNATVARQQAVKAKLPQQKADREAAITARFAASIHQVQTAGAGATFNASGLLSSQLAALTSDEAKARQAIPTHAPSGWTGSAAAWAAQRDQERGDVTAEFTARRDALQHTAREHGFEGRLAQSNALFGLRTQETAEKHTLSDTYATQTRDLAAKIKQSQGLVTQAKKYVASDQTALTDATGNNTGSLAPKDVSSSSFYGTLQQYIDPMGTLAINADTMANINIPTLLREIGSLTGTTAPAATSSATSGADQTLATLRADQLSQNTLNLEVLTRQYDALSSAIRSLPPFGGSFLYGGTVPGPVGAPRTAILHGGEQVVPVGGDTNTRHYLLIEDGAVDHRKIRAISGDEYERRSRGTARLVGLGLPSAGGGRLRP